MTANDSKDRQAEVKRETKETQIRLRLNLDGVSPGDVSPGDVSPDASPGDASPVSINTGVGFFDHMLEALAKHGHLGLVLDAKGDLHVDQHHLVEDVGIVLGQALRQALGDDLRLQRFGSAYVPLDDALARSVVDISGRAFLHFGVTISRSRVGEFDTDLVREFFQAFAANARLNLHLDLIHGDNAHHQIEAIFKATAVALRQALRRVGGAIPSTKGTIE